MFLKSTVSPKNDQHQYLLITVSIPWENTLIFYQILSTNSLRKYKEIIQENFVFGHFGLKG